jgi:hypothetical protein
MGEEGDQRLPRALPPVLERILGCGALGLAVCWFPAAGRSSPPFSWTEAGVAAVMVALAWLATLVMPRGLRIPIMAIVAVNILAFIYQVAFVVVLSPLTARGNDIVIVGFFCIGAFLVLGITGMIPNRISAQARDLGRGCLGVLLLVSATFAVVTDRRWSAAALIAAIGLTLVLTALFRLRARARWLAAIERGSLPGYSVCELEGVSDRELLTSAIDERLVSLLTGRSGPVRHLVIVERTPSDPRAPYRALETRPHTRFVFARAR